MNSNNNIQDELNELNSGLPAGGQGGPFAVPEGYFENLSGSILARLKAESAQSSAEETALISPLVAAISRNMPYEVPTGYFESNLELLPAFTSEEDSLVLSFIEKEMPYEVPAGYFSSLPDQVLAKVEKREARVVPIRKRRWMPMAIAAAVLGVVTLTGINYFGSSTAEDPATATVEIKKASTEELNAFIRSTDVAVPEDQVTAQNSGEVKALLKDVSNEELEAFLEQVPDEDIEEFDIN